MLKAAAIKARKQHLLAIFAVAMFLLWVISVIVLHVTTIIVHFLLLGGIVAAALSLLTNKEGH